MPFSEIMSKAPKVVECHANRGTTYLVAFDDERNAVWVDTVYMRGGLFSAKRTTRRIWNKHCKSMGHTAACAIRSAIAVMEADATILATPSLSRIHRFCDR